ncbi:response regulator transcription factor [Roseicitreum antarcticum]|uniref:Two-component system, OmpR family, response regulator n=1 Tax=Roseicitreum antarcticum TaxID=564137 RepID=A0A1H2VIP4_9RHOB|nr:response regulator transcription factor [Roseicitreum antarcticum]SDW68201.1 two-component system, OmpR family, response regulator [Roseicitreum antarcticum]
MTIPRLLVVDDDVEMCAMMVGWLQRNGFAAVGVHDGAGVAQRMDQGRVDLILLDVMLGDESGLRICQKLREDHDVPIIMVSALSADDQRMAGYRSGADDYIAKPFNPELLVARVRAVLRRARRATSLAYRRQSRVYAFAGWRYDTREGSACAPGGFEVALSTRERQLLQVLLANPEIPLSRDEIAEAMDLLGEGTADPAEGRAIDMLVGRLRGKIEETPKEPALIRTARGVGYVLACSVKVL